MYGNKFICHYIYKLHKIINLKRKEVTITQLKDTHNQILKTLYTKQFCVYLPSACVCACVCSMISYACPIWSN